MQIQNSVNAAAIFQSGNNQAVDARRQNDEAQARLNQPDKSSDKQKFEQELIKFDPEQVKLLDKENRRQQSTSYDQPSGKSRLAIQAYQGVNNIEQRANVREFLGVDVFA